MEAKKICPFMSGFSTSSCKEKCPEALNGHFNEAHCQKELCALWVEGTEGQAGHCGMRK
jgi:hypothetical protein